MQKKPDASHHPDGVPAFGASLNRNKPHKAAWIEQAFHTGQETKNMLKSYVTFDPFMPIDPIFGCVRLTDASVTSESLVERKGSHHFHPEPCAGHREVSGEASVGACAGRAIGANPNRNYSQNERFRAELFVAVLDFD